MVNSRFAIVGGGIGGLTLAIALQRKGISATVFESAPALKPLGAGLTLAGNAVRALMELGIADAAIAEGKVISSMAILDQRGRILTSTHAVKLSEKLGVVNNFTIHRGDLHRVLSSQLPAGTIVLNKTCSGINQQGEEVELSFSDGTSTRADYVIACDGVHSVIRRTYIPESLPRYAGYTCWRGVIDSIPDSVDMRKTTETWGRGQRFGIVPLAGNRIYWFATLNASQGDPVLKQYGVAEVKQCFQDYHYPVGEVIERTPEDRLIWSDIIDLKPIRQFAFGRVVLIGDAAHATTPNMGQGACMAIEDAVILANEVERHANPIEAFVAFEKKRIGRTTRIVNDSYRLGRMAQWQNPMLARVRNALVRLTPASVAEKQVRYLTDVSFS